jgi:sigma-B regulation protein RsbU (phosphoserine phosphatase)
MANIIVVDDERSITYLLSEVLKKDKHRVTALSDGKMIAPELKKGDCDLVISDLHMKEVGGIEVLKAVKSNDESTEVLILTGHGTISSAVEAMKFGAFEYLTKPIDMEEFRLKVQKALERRSFKLQIEKQRKEIHEQQELIRKDLKLAEQVQRSLVPKPINLESIDVSVKYMPMIGLGGDFADIYYDGVENVYLTLVDVTGHGITAALLVNRISNEIRNFVREKIEPASILYHVNNFIFDAFDGMAMFLTMFSGVVNIRKGTFTYAGSAHPAVILWKKRDNEFLKLESQNIIIGYEKRDENRFLQDTVVVGAEDKLIMYTDGIIETEDAGKRQLGINGLVDFFRQSIYLPVDEIADMMITGIKDYSPQPLKDDVYLILVGLK